MRKKLSIFAIFALLTLGFWFLEPISLHLGEKGWELYCKYSLGKKWSCYHIAFKNGEIAIQNPKISAALMAERANIGWRDSRLQLHFDGPVINVKGFGALLKSTFKQGRPSRLGIDLDIPSGHLKLGSGDLIPFSVVNQNLRVGEKSELTGEWDGSQLVLQWDSLDAPLFIQLLEPLLPKGVKSIEGSVSGSLISHFHEESSNLDMTLTLGPSSARVMARQLGGQWDFVECIIENLQSDAFISLKEGLQGAVPFLNDLEMTSGKLDVTFFTYLKKKKPAEVKIKEILGEEIAFTFHPLQMNIAAKHLSGALYVDFLKHYKQESLEGNLLLKGGRLSWDNPHYQQWHLDDIETTLVFSQGRLQRSELRGVLGGMRTTLSYDPKLKNTFQIASQGDVARLLPFIPAGPVLKRLEGVFLGEQLSIGAVVQLSETIHVSGDLNLFSPGEPHPETMTFDFDVEKSRETLWHQWPPSDFLDVYSRQVACEVLQSALPPTGGVLGLLVSEWMQREIGVFGLTLRNGHFYLCDVAFEKFVGPLLFDKEMLLLKGRGSFTGVFDHEQVQVDYQGQGVTVENSSFNFEIPDFKGGRHHFNLQTGSHFGVLPIHGGSFLEKKCALQFVDVDAEVILEGSNIHVHKVETFCEGVFFEGDVEVALVNLQEGYYSVEIASHKALGTVSQIKHLLSHFRVPEVFNRTPLSGNVSYGEQGGYLKFAQLENEYVVEVRFTGELTEGELLIPNQEIAITDISLDFEYDWEKQKCDFTDLEGIALIGKPKHVQEYLLKGDGIRYTNLKKHNATFDLALVGEKGSLLNLVGTTLSDKRGISVLLDFDKSHIAGSHPTEFSLLFDPKGAIKSFQTHLSGSLDQLKPFYNLGEIHGDIEMAITYDPEEKAFCFDAQGNHLEAHNKVFEYGVLKGRKIGSHYIIDEFLLDAISVSADLFREDWGWKVNFLGVRWEEAFLLGLVGDYREDNHRFNWQINLLQSNFLHLFGVPVSAFSVERAGGIRGELVLDFNSSAPAFVLLLEDGVYAINGQEHDLAQCVIEMDPMEFRILTQYCHNSHLFWVLLQLADFEGSRASLILANTHPYEREKGSKEPLQLNFDRGALTSICGHFAGLSVDLLHQQEEGLIGDVGIDLGEVLRLSPPQFRDSLLTLGLGAGYRLMGKWDLSLQNWRDSRFEGSLYGENFVFKGYEFEALQGRCQLSKEGCVFQEVVVSDPALELSLPTFCLDRRGQEGWAFDFSSLVMRDFRPRMLLKAGSQRANQVSGMMVDRLSVEMGRGDCLDPLSWRGKGSVAFSRGEKSPPRKGLLAIPGDILSRLGLDLSVLTPVKGHIDYNLKDGKFYLKKLRDTYSKNGHSQFYLAERTPSSVDLSGNLDLHIRMKHYNLLFKLTELFTFNVQGPLSAPVYRLEGQS